MSHTSSQSSDDEEPYQRPKPNAAPKKGRNSRDDLSGNVLQPTRTRERRQPSARKAEIEKADNQKRLTALEKENTKLKKQVAGIKSSVSAPAGDDEDEPESEDGFDTRSFPSSITPLATLTVLSPKIDLRKMLKKHIPSVQIRRVSQDIYADRMDDHPSNRSHSSTPSQNDIPSSPSPPDHWPAMVSPSQTLSSANSDRNSSAPPAGGSSQKRRHAQMESPIESTPPNPKRIKPVPAFSSRYVDGGRAKAGDYDSPGHGIIIHSQHGYESRIIGIAPFPDTATRTKWAKSAWRAACRVAEEEYDITDRIIRLISARGSRIRGSLLGTTRQCVALSYGFRSESSKGAGHHNLVLHNKLVRDSAFIYKDVDQKTGFAEHSVIRSIISEALFAKGSQSYGILYKKYFESISVATIALILTQIKHCIGEYSTGLRKIESFTEQAQKAQYTAMLNDVTVWSELNPDVTLKIRQRMFTKAYGTANISTRKVMPHVTNDVQARMRAELAARTGDTDSESERELSEDENPPGGELDTDISI